MTSKQLLINGCSFTAGDDLAWDYDQQANYLDADDSLHAHYTREIRPNYNLSGQLIKQGYSTIDLSRDGTSNMEIMFTTMGKITALSADERRHLHCCIGWTQRTRLCRWSPSLDCYKSITVSNLNWAERLQAQDNYWRKYHKDFAWAQQYYGHLSDRDYLEDLSAMISLEQYLIAEGIGYTFWNALNPSLALEDQKNLKLEYGFDLDKVSDADQWLGNRDFGHPYFSRPWAEYLAEDQDKYLTKNLHPSQRAVEELAAMIKTTL
jgi:hypothetical protein